MRTLVSNANELLRWPLTPRANTWSLVPPKYDVQQTFSTNVEDSDAEKDVKRLQHAKTVQ